MALQLRPYQTAAVESLRSAYRAGARWVVLCLPTGAGKTETAAYLIQEAVRKKSRVAFICDRRTLVEQTARRFRAAGIHADVVMRSQPSMLAPLQVCSAQTLARRGMEKLGKIDLAIIDECHTLHGNTVTALKQSGVRVLGLSATPFTAGLVHLPGASEQLGSAAPGDLKGYRKEGLYHHVVTGTTTRDLIESRHLMMPRVKFMESADLDEVRVDSRSGEWSGTGLADAMADLLGDIPETWEEQTGEVYGERVRTLVFAPTIRFGADLVERWRAAGYDFRHVHANDHPAEREENLAALRDGECDGLVSVDALGKGYDEPAAECLVDARPFRKSFAGYVQMLGRIMRISPGKRQPLVLDHSGNRGRFGAMANRFFAEGWNYSYVSGLGDGTGEPVTKDCRECGATIAAGCRVCPVCGAVLSEKRVVVADGELREEDTELLTTEEVVAKYQQHPYLMYMVQGWVEQRPSRWSRATPENRVKGAFLELSGRYPTAYGVSMEWDPMDCPDDLADVLDANAKAWRKRNR